MFNDLIVLGMRANPEPDEIVTSRDSQSTIMRADSNGPKSSDTFETQRGKPRIRF
jgi:hypothetical protein